MARAFVFGPSKPSPGRLRLEALEPRETPALIGGLDPSFGIGGKATLTIAGAGVAVEDVVVDGVGRVVVVGSVPGAGGTDFLVLRFNPDGTPDNSFGTAGKVTVDFGGGADVGRGVAVDAGNNVVAVGSAFGGGATQMAFVRLTAADGSPDAGFGGGGNGQKLVAAPAGFTNLNGSGLAIDKDGTIVAVGWGNAGAFMNDDIAVVRLNPTGTAIDPAFNGGTVKTLAATATSNDTANAVAIDKSGNIVAAGWSADAGGTKFEVARLLPGGALDPAFNAGTVLTFNAAAGTLDLADGVDTDPAGNVYLAGPAAWPEWTGSRSPS
jgi:uncharacterized delta-60 repeat protein